MVLESPTNHRQLYLVRGADGKISLTPHTVKVAHGAKTATRQVAMDKPQEIAIKLE